MRSMIRHALLASAALTLLAGCAQLSVQTDYNPAKPLPPLRTYQLGEVRVYDAQGRLDADNTLQKDRIGRVLATAFAERGVSPLSRQADVQVNVEVEQREVSQIIDPRPRVSVGIGRGIYPGWGLGWQVPMQRDYQEGRLRVDLLKDGALLWRGETRTTLNSNGQWDEAGMLDGMRQVIKALPPPAP